MHKDIENILSKEREKMEVDFVDGFRSSLWNSGFQLRFKNLREEINSRLANGQTLHSRLEFLSDIAVAGFVSPDTRVSDEKEEPTSSKIIRFLAGKSVDTKKMDIILDGVSESDFNSIIGTHSFDNANYDLLNVILLAANNDDDIRDLGELFEYRRMLHQLGKLDGQGKSLNSEVNRRLNRNEELGNIIGDLDGEYGSSQTGQIDVPALQLKLKDIIEALSQIKRLELEIAKLESENQELSSRSRELREERTRRVSSPASQDTAQESRYRVSDRLITLPEKLYIGEEGSVEEMQNRFRMLMIAKVSIQTKEAGSDDPRSSKAIEMIDQELRLLKFDLYRIFSENRDQYAENELAELLVITIGDPDISCGLFLQRFTKLVTHLKGMNEFGWTDFSSAVSSMGLHLNEFREIKGLKVGREQIHSIKGNFSEETRQIVITKIEQEMYRRFIQEYTDIQETVLQEFDLDDEIMNLLESN